MCIESMDVKRSREEVRPRACLRLKCTKWRRMKCLGNKREKLMKKWRVNRTTARKSCRQTRTRKTRDKQSYWIRFASRYKARNVSPLMKLEGGHVPPGTMAPGNTTQYLMRLVYQDFAYEDEMCSSVNISTAMDFSGHDQCRSVYADSTSPQNVYMCLDSAYESTVEFQERDFENVFQLYGGAS